MTQIKMRETRTVAPDGANPVEWAAGETFDVADQDLLDLLVRENAAEIVKENKKEPAPAKKPDSAKTETKTQPKNERKRRALGGK